MFNFGQQIAEFLDSFEFDIDVEYDTKGQIDFTSYDLDSMGLSLIVTNGTIDHTRCDKSCIYKRRNLIGLHFEEFMKIVDCKYAEDEVDTFELDDDEIPHIVYEFEDIGLQVWVKK